MKNLFEPKDISYDLDHWARIADRMASSEYAQKHGNMQFGVTDGRASYITIPLEQIKGPIYYRTGEQYVQQ